MILLPMTLLPMTLLPMTLLPMTMLKTKIKISYLFTLIAILIPGVSNLAANSANESQLNVSKPATALYQQHCAECHEGGVPKAPHSITFQLAGPEAIIKAMQDGVMKNQASSLNKDEQIRLAEFLGGRTLSNAQEKPVALCKTDESIFDMQHASALTGWGMTPENTRFIGADTAGLELSDVPRLGLKWAFAYPNATRARSQPAIAGDTIFVGSQDGTVYALDFNTGCARWTFKAEAEVRSAITITSWPSEDPDNTPYALFGDFNGYVYALNAATGELIWRSSLEDHADVTITGSPKLHNGRLYVPMSSSEWASAADPAYACCTFRGGVAAFDITDGHLIWKSYSIPENPKLTGEKNKNGIPTWSPAGAPIWSSPTIDVKRNRIYVGTGEAYTSPAAATSDAVIAFNLDNGDIEWTHQAITGDAWNMSCYIGDATNCPEENGPDFDIGAPPVLLNLKNGRDVLLIGQKSGYVYALDPDKQGTLIWKKKTGLGGFAGGVHWGMAANNGILYAPNADTNFINKWKGKRNPGLYALNALTGDQLWFTAATNVCAKEMTPACDPGLSAAVTVIPGVVFAGAFDGHIRAYDSQSGKVIWDFNTVRKFETVSGEVAVGGSIESDGPVIVNGNLLINSGYLYGSRMAGNVLLVFSVDGK